MSKCQKFIFIGVKVSLDGVIDSEFQGRDVAQVRMMAFAEPAKESSSPLLRGIFLKRGGTFRELN